MQENTGRTANDRSEHQFATRLGERDLSIEGDVVKGAADHGGGREVRVTREQARRYLVGRDLLARRRPSSAPAVVEAVRKLEYVQIDPVFVVERNHHLVLWSRLDGYRPDDLDEALYGCPDLIEVMGFVRMIVPTEDFPLFRPAFDRVRAENERRFAALAPLMEQVRERIRGEGPLSSAEIEDDGRVDSWWRASARAANQALNLLWYTGQVAVSGRRNNRQYFDLPERVVPAAILEKRPADPERELTLKYLDAYGLGLPADVQYGWFHAPSARRTEISEQLVEEGLAVRVVLEGAKRPYYAPKAEEEALVAAASPSAVPASPFTGAHGPLVRFLAPLDNLLASRRRLSEVFGFDYTWEIYLKPEKRKYGAYTMVVLYGDRLVGRFSPSLDRANGVLNVEGFWLEDQFEPTPGHAPDHAIDHAFSFTEGLLEELKKFARFHGAGVVRFTGPRPPVLKTLGDKIKT